MAGAASAATICALAPAEATGWPTTGASSAVISSNGASSCTQSKSPAQAHVFALLYVQIPMVGVHVQVWRVSRGDLLLGVSL